MFFLRGFPWRSLFLDYCMLSCYNNGVVSGFCLCLSSFLCLRLRAFPPSVSLVLVPRPLLLPLPCLLCCLSCLLVCACPSAALVALMPLFVGFLLGRPLCWSLPLPLVGLAWVALPLPVVLLAVCCPSLLVLVVCWWLFPSVLVLLVFVLRVPSLVGVRVLSALPLWPLVVVGGFSFGCPLALSLLPGLPFVGLLLALSVLRAVGGWVCLPLLPRSCRCFELVCRFCADDYIIKSSGSKSPSAIACCSSTIFAIARRTNS